MPQEDTPIPPAASASPSPAGDDQEQPPHEEARRILIVTKMGLLGLYRSQLPRMAAALAYRTIFSIIPVMAIGLLIFGSVVSDDQVESGVRRVLDFAGISQISTVEAGSEETDDDVDLTQVDAEPVQDQPDAPLDPQAEQDGGEAQPLAPVGEEPGQTLASDPFAGADLEQVITDLINRVNTSIRSVPTGWIALTSGLVLLYAAMSMLIEIEKSFNQICGAPSGRGWLRRLILYWTILTAGSLLLAATFLVGDAFTRWVLSIAGRDSLVGAMMAGYGVSVLISTLLLLGAYTTIPNTRVKLRSALAGAFFAAVLWELGKLGFTTYLRYTTGYAKFYGSVAILPLFMLWVYLTWLIVLFGMQVTFALQHFSRLVDSKLRAAGDGDRHPTLIDPLVMLVIAKLVQQGFRDGTPIDADGVAERTRLQPAQAAELLEALTDAKVVSKVYQGEAFTGWTPTRPADRTPLRDVLTAAHKVDAFRTSAADDELPSVLVNAAFGACDGKTLADLLKDEPKPGPGDSA